mmetsp:Transcript_55443/g.98765  ORF Transcript_55443/g.98765 Transcript_55443/m.98765 type:complete len:225 (+) Transcript_55443:968-1642(+)
MDLEHHPDLKAARQEGGLQRLGPAGAGGASLCAEAQGGGRGQQHAGARGPKELLQRNRPVFVLVDLVDDGPELPPAHRRPRLREDRIYQGPHLEEVQLPGPVLVEGLEPAFDVLRLLNLPHHLHHCTVLVVLELGKLDLALQDQLRLVHQRVVVHEDDALGAGGEGLLHHRMDLPHIQHPVAIHIRAEECLRQPVGPGPAGRVQLLDLQQVRDAGHELLPAGVP